MVVEVGAVGDEDDGGAAQGLALHEQTREEEHGERLAATRGAEIGAAFAIATRVEFAVVMDVLIERTGSEILWIAADELPLVLRGVREIDEVVDDIDEAVLAEQAGNHRLERRNAAVGLVLGVDLAPGIEELVRRVKRAELVVHPVGDDDECRVFEQCGNVATVADGELLVGIHDGRVLLERVLEFEHHHRQAVDKNNGIGNAVLVAHDVELVDDFEEVVFLVRLVESDGIDIEVLFGGVFPFQRKAVHELVEGVFVFVIERAAGLLHDDTDSRFHLLVGDAIVLVAVVQVFRQIVAQHHLVEVAHDVLTFHILIALLLQQGDDGLFQLAFVEIKHGIFSFQFLNNKYTKE